MNWSDEAEVALYESLDDYANRISAELDEGERRAALVSAIASLIDARVAKAIAAIRSGADPDAE